MRFSYIEFARGYAIFSIVCFHTLQKLPLSPLFQQAIIFGGTGVHLFFLLSGFGLGLGKPVSTLDFFKKRFIKVLLPYILVLSISLGVSVLTNVFPDRWQAWLAGVGLYQMFSERFIESFGGHFWFISTIFQFYIAYPFLLFLKNKIGAWPFFAVCLAGSIGWWLVVYFAEMGEMRVWNSFFLQFLWEFGLGMTLADCGFRILDFGFSETTPAIHLPASVFSSKKLIFTRLIASIRNPKSKIQNHFWAAPNFWIYLPIGIIGTAIMILMILKLAAVGKIFNDIPAMIGYTSLSIFLFRFSERFVPPVERFFRWIGSFSFSLYLTHILVLELFLLFLQKIGQPVAWFWLVGFVILALLVGRLFEPISVKWVSFFEKK
jgi:peptidoglycan/LPS O-acetylase OafA/YrhL